MASKAVFILAALCCTQISAGLWFRPFGPLPGFQGQVLNLKFKLISAASTSRKQLQAAETQLKSEVDLAKTNIDNQQSNLQSAVDLASQSADEAGNNISACVDVYNANIELINATVLKLDAADDEVRAIKSNLALLNRQIGNSSRIINDCKLESLTPIALPEDLGNCVTNKIAEVEKEADRVQELVNSGIQDLDNFVPNIKSEVDQLIDSATEEFNSCVSSQ